MAAIGAIGARSENGTDNPATARKMSGRHSAAFHATGAPQSWPTITACRSPKRGNESNDVADEVKLRVGVVLVRRIALSVAALIRRDDVKARVSERGQLMAPRIPRLRKAMTQHDERSRAGFSDVHVDSVRRDRAVLNDCHGDSLIHVV